MMVQVNEVPDVNLLLLRRGAVYDKDPAAIRAWNRYLARRDELMAQWAVERFGLPLDLCNHDQRQELRSDAGPAAAREL